MMRILKLGGSLLDWPRCGEALRHWQRSQPSLTNFVIVGGGAAVDAVRQRGGSMTDEAAHWASIRCMEENAIQFASDHALPTVGRVDDVVDDMVDGSSEEPLFVLTQIERHLRTSALPMNWDVTSDSIAAWFAETSAASELVLLKSCDGLGRTAVELSRDGVVDAYFPNIAERIAFRVVNLSRYGNFCSLNHE